MRCDVTCHAKEVGGIGLGKIARGGRLQRGPPRWVGEREGGDFGGGEPVQVVVLVGGEVGGLAGPGGDEVGAHVQLGGVDGHRREVQCGGADAELFTALAANGLLGGLARLDVTAGDVPTVGKPAPVRVAMHEQQSVVAHDQRAHHGIGHCPSLPGERQASAGQQNGGVSVPDEWLSTDRLSLRPPTPGDVPAEFELLTNPLVVYHNPSDAVSVPADVMWVLRRWIYHWAQEGFGNCCVFEKDSGALVGNCGIRRSMAETQPVLNLMYRFDPSVWGRGYATEAARAVLGWAREHLPGEVVLARVRPENTASQRVAVAIGLERDPLFDSEGSDGQEWAYTTRLD